MQCKIAIIECSFLYRGIFKNFISNPEGLKNVEFVAFEGYFGDFLVNPDYLSWLLEKKDLKLSRELKKLPSFTIPRHCIRIEEEINFYYR